MQKLFILKAEVSFELIAALLMETDLLLNDVVSCTFPSRPEPKSAHWEIDEVKMMDYLYLPDIEIRYLSLLNSDFLAGQEFQSYFADLTNLALFEAWEDLIIVPMGDYRKNVRVMHALRVGAEIGDPSQRHLHRLVQALETAISAGDNVSAEGIAETLREIAQPEIESQLRDAYEKATSLTVRAHVRKAIDTCMSRLEF